MIFRKSKWFVLPAAAVLLATAGCRTCCPGQNSVDQTAACQAPDLSCPKPPNGYVNENEKDPKKARKNAKKDAKINADGCSPECERIPLLKRIADKENLASDDPVIKIAAKIKHKEEMCQQKVKAVKYLGTIGCCCYDKDGEVGKALLDALDDCLPAVRLAAVQAIGGCVCGEAYPRTCCTPEIAKKLAEMAQSDAEQQIREWAAYVAQYCHEGVAPKGPEVKEGPKPLEGGTETKKSEEVTPADPAAAPQTSNDAIPAFGAEEQGEAIVAVPGRLIHNGGVTAAVCQPNATFPVAAEGVSTPEALPESNAVGTDIGRVSYNGSETPVPFESIPTGFAPAEREIAQSVQAETPVVAPTSTPVAVAPITTPAVVVQVIEKGTLQGRIESINLENETAVIRLSNDVHAPVNCRVHVSHKYALGRVQSIGEFEVLFSGRGTVTIRPVAGTSLRKISVGDAASVFCG